MRLDIYIKSLLHSRTKAQEAIESGCVKVNDKVIYKSSTPLAADDRVQLDSIKLQSLLVGRAGYKLRGFIEALVNDKIWQPTHLQDKSALDVGSSTGGFAEVLLHYGVKDITCVDVGKNQLHEKIRKNARVRVFEECDIRDFMEDRIYNILVCDVSFISLYKLIEHFKKFMCQEFIWLFKPQFEVGRTAKRDKKGVIKNSHLVQETLQAFCQYAAKEGFNIISVKPSVLKGKDGNEEFFIYSQR